MKTRKIYTKVQMRKKMNIENKVHKVKRKNKKIYKVNRPKKEKYQSRKKKKMQEKNRHRKKKNQKMRRKRINTKRNHSGTGRTKKTSKKRTLERYKQRDQEGKLPWWLAILAERLWIGVKSYTRGYPQQRKPASP